jgi:hypothetical protein
MPLYIRKRRKPVGVALAMLQLVGGLGTVALFVLVFMSIKAPATCRKVVGVAICGVG